MTASPTQMSFVLTGNDDPKSSHEAAHRARHRSRSQAARILEHVQRFPGGVTIAATADYLFADQPVAHNKVATRLLVLWRKGAVHRRTAAGVPIPYTGRDVEPDRRPYRDGTSIVYWPGPAE